MKSILALLACLWCAPALAACGPDATPAAAAAYGLTCEVFVDNMTTSATFDVTDSGLPGFNWYIHNAWPNSRQTNCGGSPRCWPTFNPAAAQDYSISSSGLTINIISGAPTYQYYPGSMFNTCRTASNPQGYVGTTFSGSFYVQETYTYSGTPSDGAPGFTMWMWPVEALTNINTPIPTGEFDMLESVYGRSLHEWIGSGSSYACCGYNNLTVSGGTSPSATLNVVPSSNLGAGLVNEYSAGTLYSTVSYGTTGAFASLANGHYCLMLNSDQGVVGTISKIAVWQAPVVQNPGGRHGVFR